MSTNLLIMKFPYASSEGGGERHTVSLVEGLLKSSVRTYLFSSCPVLLSSFRARGWAAARSWAPKEPVATWSLLLFPIVAIPFWLYLTAVLIWYRAARRVKVLYCLSLTEKVLIVPVARLMGIRVIFVEHSAIGRWLSANPLRFLYALHARLVTVVTVSRAVADQLRALGVPERRVRVIYPGVRLAGFPPRTGQTATAHRFTVGTIARLSKEKGIEYLISAVSTLVPIIPSIRLVVVGAGPEGKRLLWLTNRLGIAERVQFAGFARDVGRWLPLFDCFVLPSVAKESFGIVLVEAQAAGVPVVASRISGTAEIIDDRRTGLLVAPGDPKVLADAIDFLYRHPDEARHYATAARANVERRFTLDRMIEEFSALLNP